MLDYVLELGMKPHIELGQKPKTMHFEIGQSNREKQGDDYTGEQWRHVMTAFMRHLSTRYGQNELDDWRMELWFDEDQRGIRAEWEKYLEKFRITYEIVKSCNEKIEVGGCGIRMDSDGQKMQDFLKLWQDTSVLPDFLSVMFYAYERGGDGKDIHARRSTDEDLFIHMLKRTKDNLAQAGMEQLPLYVCEWNFTLSVRNTMNDTCFKAAYIIRNILSVYGEVQSMGFGAGSDRQYSSYDTSDLLFGGTGLVCKEGILKPAAFALEFLNRSYDKVIGKDDHYIITTDGHNNYAIACHNQQKLNDSYFLTPETNIQRDAIWKYFEKMRRLQLHLRLDDLADGEYRIKIYRVNNQYGSVLDTWAAMNYENELTKRDINYLKRNCAPHMTIRKMQTSGGSLLIQEELAPNEIAFFSIRKIF